MIIDVFLYCGEAEMARARIRELAPHVDLFLLVEADFTFSGKVRSLTFPLILQELRDLARMYRPQRPAEVRPFPLLRASPRCQELETATVSAWNREAFCRDAPREELLRLGAGPGDLIFVSDCDEIPDFRQLDLAALPQQLATRGPHALLMDFYYYNFTCRKKGAWPGTLVLAGNQLGADWETLRQKRGELPLLASGWHLSYFMSPAEMKEKIESFSHQEFNLPGLRDPAVLATRVKLRQDVFGRGEGEDLLAVSPLANRLPRTYFYLPDYMKG